MARLLVIAAALVVTAGSVAFTQDSREDIRLFMPDAQMKNLPVRVYITHDISQDMNPVLRLSRWISTDQNHGRQNPTIKPVEVAPKQQWTQTIRGQDVSFSGTLLMFDLREYPIAFYKPMTRVVPVLAWEETQGKTVRDQSAVAENEVYLGNMLGAIGWTVLLVGTLIVLVARWSSRISGSLMGLCTTPGGKLSLARTQICAWTLAIGSLVAMFGFIRLQVPDLPDSLLVLMGLSLATSGISYVQAVRNQKPQEPRKPRNWKFSDLISDVDSDTGEEHPSIPRSQMLVWTGILLTLFVAKSLIDGVLWNVPWEMVALMGMSQAGYLSPKFVNPTNQPGQPAVR